MANAIYCVACWQFAREDLKMDKRLRQTAAFVGLADARAHIKFLDLK